MAIKPLKIGDLTIPIPIIQGGMGIGVSKSRLAAAVANALYKATGQRFDSQPFTKYKELLG